MTAALLLLLALPASALELGSWVVFWDKGSEAAYAQHGARLDEVVVFAYRFDEGGRMIPAAPGLVAVLERLKRSRRPGQRLLLSVVNDTTRAGKRVLKDPERVSEFLSSPEKSEAHLRELLGLVSGLDGLELDYENLRGADGPAYARFVAELGGRLRARGQRLHLVAQAKLDLRPGDGGRALDWAELGRHVDRLSVMLYNYRGEGSREPGPVCPPEWAARVLDLALSQVPKEKLAAILALHGFSWAPGEKGASLSFQQAHELARQAGTAPVRDPRTGSSTFQAGGKTVWFEDAESVARKAALAAEKGVAAVYLWRLGAGDPAAWAAADQSRKDSDKP